MITLSNNFICYNDTFYLITLTFYHYFCLIIQTLYVMIKMAKHVFVFSSHVVEMGFQKPSPTPG